MPRLSALRCEGRKQMFPTSISNWAASSFYGCSSASGEVGGDLIDVTGMEDRWVAYVADVSGHGARSCNGHD
jgi:serine phosphatase RsbU (regulator of sigma subunit)